MSNTGSSSVKFLKSMCLNNVKPRINAINAKNKFISFYTNIRFFRNKMFNKINIRAVYILSFLIMRKNIDFI